MRIPIESQCRERLLHEWVLIGDDDTVLSEECVYCLEKAHYNKKEGRIDNVKYYLRHLRDNLQPKGSMLPLFEEVYGKSYRKNHKPIKRGKSMEEAKQDVRDTLKYLDRHPSKDPWAAGGKKDLENLKAGKI